MSDYSKTTNFATKDALVSGDANKIIKGTELDTEFTNIQTAVATKANSASPTFTGTATAAALNVTGAATVIDGSFNITGSSDATKKVAFEVDGLTTATTRTLTAQDRSGVLAVLANFPKAIQGLTYANGADVVNDIDIAAGACIDATGAKAIILAAITKQLDAAWAVGTNAGGLDTGAIGNSDYYIWAILRSDTGVTDALFSLSSTAPTMPTNYDFKRLIGWFKRVAATIVAFTTYETDGGGLELVWTVPTLDINLTNTLTTARRTDAVKVPLNFSVTAHLNALMYDATTPGQGWLYCPDQTDAAPSSSVTPLANFDWTAAKAALQQIRVRTSSAGLVAARGTVATVDSYLASTMGFTWARRN